LWVSAPGGEYGLNPAYFGGSTTPSAFKPAIITTARDGCANRSYAPAVAGLLDAGTSPISLNCQYAATMNGTSAAAPNVSGVIALMLEANPSLGPRDIKDILARTARRVEPSLLPIVTGGLVPGAVLTLEQGWVVNAAGFAFSNTYGFGSIDASAAVTRARATTTLLPALRTASYSNTPADGTVVPAASARGYSIDYAVTDPMAFVEHVTLQVSLASTPALLCNQIELTSPAGTRSIVLHAATGYAQTSLTAAQLGSNAFYGESATGTWRLSFYNFCSGATQLPTATAQTLLLFGH
jgi:hypothetical protein